MVGSEVRGEREGVEVIGEMLGSEVIGETLGSEVTQQHTTEGLSRKRHRT